MNNCKSLTIILIISVFSNMLAADLEITELCFENIKPEWPSWIEVQNISSEVLNLKGYSIRNRGQNIFIVEDGLECKSGEYVLLHFYEGDNTSPEFERVLPIGTKFINILNSDVFKEAINEFTLDPASINYLVDRGRNIELRGIEEILKEPDKAVELKNEEDMIVYYVWCLSQEKKNTLYNLYRSFADEFCLKYQIPRASEPFLIKNFYNRTLYSGDVELLSPAGEVKATILWMNGISWRDRVDLKKQMGNILVGRDNFLIGREESYLGYARDGMPNFTGKRGFSPILDIYDSSPGTEQTIQPFKDLKLDLTDDILQTDQKITLQMDFHPFHFPLNKWQYEFELASDKDFKQILFSKKGTPDKFLWLRRIYFGFPSEEYEGMILWHPELYYRARRILPDGYKTEWAGGKCGELLRKRYTNQKKYKEFLEMEKYFKEEVEPRLAEVKRIKEEIKRIDENLKKEKKIDKRGELQAQIDEARKKLEEADQEYTKHSDEYWRMSSKMKREYNPPASKE